ncbi:hypothetical protein OSTOST_15059 [Ostertagia ostertagi]
MKSELINEALQLLREESINKMFRPRVLDLACGKGGDLRKWKIANVDSVVMAGGSIESDKRGYDEMAQRERNGLFPVEFLHVDCCKENLKEKITGSPEFDCQMPIRTHYSFLSMSNQLVSFYVMRQKPYDDQVS